MEEILSTVQSEVFGVWFLIGAALVFWMQAVESHLFDVAFVCRAYVSDLLEVSGVCGVCVARSLVAAVMLAVLDVDSVTKLPHVTEPVLDP